MILKPKEAKKKKEKNEEENVKKEKKQENKSYFFSAYSFVIMIVVGALLSNCDIQLKTSSSLHVVCASFGSAKLNIFDRS